MDLCGFWLYWCCVDYFVRRHCFSLLCGKEEGLGLGWLVFDLPAFECVPANRTNRYRKCSETQAKSLLHAHRNTAILIHSLVSYDAWISPCCRSGAVHDCSYFQLRVMSKIVFLIIASWLCQTSHSYPVTFESAHSDYTNGRLIDLSNMVKPSQCLSCCKDHE